MKYLSPPKDFCQLCRKTLYGVDRYKIRVFSIEHSIMLKELVICESCFRGLLNDEGLKGRFKIKYRKMRPLKLWWTSPTS